jgi:ATP-dependent DNA helicase MPH1
MSSPHSEEFSDLDDDDVLVAASQTSSFDSVPGDEDSPRPPKRRRLHATNRTSDPAHLAAEETSSVNKTDCSDVDSASSADDLPPPPRRGFSEYTDRDSPGEKISKYKVFIPKHTSIQENTFVSQLTQPHSSPSKIRGPRWKRPDPELPQTSVTPEVSGEINGGEREEDQDLRAAIAASLESFEVENPEVAAGSNSNLSITDVAPDIQAQADIGFDLDDIPEDAFDSSPSLSPRTGVNDSFTGNSRPTASQFSKQRLQSQRANLRQTTLFDLAARDIPQGTRSWSPPPKDEPPTHHKLDVDAMQTWVYPTNLGRIRDYQFNIVQKGLFHNLLVALPTGLGKTFIAATIMLNWLRWTRNAQLVFVAPTKPLVSQQVSACLEIAGIPRSQTTLLTGNVPPGTRAEEWQTKRVFFMTPQTLINDLKTGIADPKRIVLLVVDEAHRATGGYAYVEVVKFLRRFNKSFRVLALTATPGSTVEAVQAVIDGLDIARVEIRTEQSLDIRDYVHARNIDIQTFTNSEEMLLCMDLLSKALQPSVDQLRSLNAYWGRDPMTLTAYGLTKARQQWMGSDAGRNANFGLKGKVNALFTVLASLAHAIDLLKYHGIVPFYRHLVSFRSNTEGQKGGKYQRQIVEDQHFIKLMNHLQPWVSDVEFIGHPKLKYLREVVLNHFMDAGEGLDSAEGPNTRVMIFAHFRDSAEEITRVLKRQEPIIRPHVFVGQANAKGSEGMGQKTQLSVVEKFKKGTYNTIVATSIGEEGLDIGEIDLIVCYDSSASPIRMLQRMGRTGRKRAGNIMLLLMEGKEEESYTKAKDNYEKMQQMIASGTRFTFHDDRSPRILPKDAKPAVDKRHIEIPPENSQQELPEPKKKARPPKRPPKKFHMPDDVETGFTKASRLEPDIGNMLRRKAGNKHKRLVRSPTPEPADIPSFEEVLLTPVQQRELEVRYRNVGGTTPQFTRRPRNDAFPILQRVPRPTKLITHGSLTRRMVDVLQKIAAIEPGCEDRYRSLLDIPRQTSLGKPRTLTSSTEDGDIQRSPQTSLARRGPVPSLEKNRMEKPGKATLLTASSYSKPAIARRSSRSPCASPDRDGSRLLSPLMCSPGASNNVEHKPFYASQLSDVDDMNLDLDLPDIGTLVDRESKPAAPKRKRTIVDDDDDEFLF